MTISLSPFETQLTPPWNAQFFFFFHLRVVFIIISISFLCVCMWVCVMVPLSRFFLVSTLLRPFRVVSLFPVQFSQDTDQSFSFVSLLLCGRLCRPLLLVSCVIMSRLKGFRCPTPRRLYLIWMIQLFFSCLTVRLYAVCALFVSVLYYYYYYFIPFSLV